MLYNYNNMVITDITEGKKNKNRVNIFLDGEYSCSVYYETVLKADLKKGSEISSGYLSELLAEDEKKYAFDTALKYLSYKMRSVLETEKKLKQCKFSSAAIEYAVTTLTELGYLDDRTYAETYFSELTERYGKILLRKKLYEKGIDREIIDELIEKTDQSVFCDELAEKLKKKYENDEPCKAKQKAFRAMVARGFSFDEIKTSLDKFFVND